ncbi:hypothetical protein ACWV2X_25545 [Streptomyces hydrogenans]
MIVRLFSFVLLACHREGDPLPHPAPAEARTALGAHCAPELGEGFVTAGLRLYREGRDSVARHGDRTGRPSTRDTLVALLSFGDPRDLVLRPRGGGPVALRPPPVTATSP